MIGGYQRVCSVIFISLMTAGAAMAQQAPRNGNVWDGVAHQPTRFTVENDEKARGVAASPQDQKRHDDAVESLARELLRNSR
jgi:hypothetical protein